MNLNLPKQYLDLPNLMEPGFYEIMYDDKQTSIIGYKRLDPDTFIRVLDHQTTLYVQYYKDPILRRVLFPSQVLFHKMENTYPDLQSHIQKYYTKTITAADIQQRVLDLFKYPFGQQLFVDQLTAKVIKELPDFHTNFYEMEGPDNTLAENHIGYYNQIRIYEYPENIEGPEPSFETGYNWYDENKPQSQQCAGCMFDDDYTEALKFIYNFTESTESYNTESVIKTPYTYKDTLEKISNFLNGQHKVSIVTNGAVAALICETEGFTLNKKRCVNESKSNDIDTWPICGTTATGCWIIVNPYQHFLDYTLHIYTGGAPHQSYKIFTDADEDFLN